MSASMAGKKRCRRSKKKAGGLAGKAAEPMKIKKKLQARMTPSSNLTKEYSIRQQIGKLSGKATGQSASIGK